MAFQTCLNINARQPVVGIIVVFETLSSELWRTRFGHVHQVLDDFQPGFDMWDIMNVEDIIVYGGEGGISV